ncbi:transcription factor bHLH18-like [Telopea speciosissima]|uniref:transcription factor bHLH18-like n=1 Tax=Telopea speciosissima TaxID=54955 RepID=UPI001CC4E8F5|nr:transcription factor bHLH18-like [Telopea speciosissima]
MEMSSFTWVSELGMDDPAFIYQCQMNSFDEFTSQNPPTLNQTSSTTTFSGSSMEAARTSGIGRSVDRPTKLLKTNSWNSCTTTSNPEPSSSPPNKILSFGGSTSLMDQSQQLYSSPDVLISQGSYYMNQNHGSKACQGIKRSLPTSRPTSHTHEHVIAERKRREKLSQRFIALSAIVPGLKKMDKVSVLGDSVRYLKHMQERVKVLEEQAKKKTMESVVVVKRTQISADYDSSSSSGENFSSDEPLPEIEARVSDKNVLIRIHCEKRKGVLMKTLAEIEKLHLCVVNSSTIPFGETALDITIVAQMEEDFSMKVKDLVRHLSSAFRQFMLQ